MKKSTRAFSFSLFLVEAVFVLLFLLTLLLFNLHFLLSPGFIKSRLREVHFYEAATTQLQELWSAQFTSEDAATGQIRAQLEGVVTPDWARSETEVNLDRLSAYLSGQIDELELSLDLIPIRERLNEELKAQKNQPRQLQLDSILPERVDFFGGQGLFEAGAAAQVEQLKINLDAANLSLKILAFLLFLTLATFFLLLSGRRAWRWVGLSLVNAGLLAFLGATALRLLSVTYLVKILASKLTAVPTMIEAITRLTDGILQTYLGLIAWQGLFVSLAGCLILLAVYVTKIKVQRKE